jgi:hypothetical protein
MSSNAPEQMSFEIYERELINPLHGHALSPLEQYVASLLLDASSEKPIGTTEIIAHVKLSLDLKITRRVLSEVVRTLRKAHTFPIMSRRKQPAGYWWCQGKDEMIEFIETFKSQARDEMHTIGVMVRANYPELAGQLRLEM